MDDAPIEVVPDSAPTDLISKDIDLLQDERRARDQDFADGIITANDHASAILEIDRRLLAISLEMDKSKPSKSGSTIVGTKKNMVSKSHF